MAGDLPPWRLPKMSASAAEELLDKAVRCRRLARHTTDDRTTEALLTLAAECETKASDVVETLKARARDRDA